MKFLNKIKGTFWLGIVSAFLSLVSCRPQFPAETEKISASAPIFPRYESGIAIPHNIAPLNFVLPDSVIEAFVEVSSSVTSRVFHIKRSFRFPQKIWRKLLYQAAQGTPDSLVIRIAARSNHTAFRLYPPLVWQLRPESIDPYLTYRLVQPIDGVFTATSLYERCLENFKTTSLMDNALMDNNCFNCHTYHNGNAKRMMIHLRKPSEGTLFLEEDTFTKVFPDPTCLKQLPDSLQMPLSLVYPSWHPDGQYIAFSTNLMGTGSYAAHRRFINLLDSAANIAVYDIKNNRILLDKSLWTSDYEETWPAWSPDGKWLYFCRVAKMGQDTVQRYPHPSERVRHLYFDLCRIAFIAEKACFSDSVQTLLHGQYGACYSEPRVHPDGEKVLVCRALFSSRPDHSFSDLVLLDTADFSIGKTIGNPAEILNSEEAESWHEWSGNGHWVVFTSKRMDGHYMFPFIAYFDGENFSKPFLLPQEDGTYYQTALRSFNLPTFTRNSSPVTPSKAAKARQMPAKPMEVLYQ